MTNENVSKASSESQAVALKLAKGIQRPEQTKAQTKLIAHGIESTRNNRKSWPVSATSIARKN